MSARAGMWDDDSIEELLDEGSGDDTQVIKQLRAALKAQTQKVKEFRSELDGLKTTSRKSTLTELLKARDINPKVVAFIPSEVEASEQGVEDWLKEYGDVFGAVQQKQEESAPPAITDQQIAALRQMDVVAAAASPAALNSQLLAIQNAQTEADLIAIITGRSVPE